MSYNVKTNIFISLLALWCSFFLLVMLPLDFATQIDSLFTRLDFIDIIATTAVVSLYFILLSLLPCMTGGVVLFFPRTERVVLWLNIVVVVTCTAYKFVSLGGYWLQKTFAGGDFALGLNSKLLLTVLLSISIIYVKRNVLIPSVENLRYIFLKRVVLPVTVAAIAAISLQIAFVTLNGKAASANVPKEQIRLPKPLPNILLITCDALTAEDMSLFGYHLETTPRLAQFAKSANVFENMYANSTFSTPGAASILTGKYPLSSKIYSWYDHIPAAISRENLAHELKKQGYTTAAIVTTVAAHPNRIRLSADFDHIINPAPKQRTVSSTISRLYLSLNRYHMDADWLSGRMQVFAALEKQAWHFFPNVRNTWESTSDYPARQTLQAAETFVTNTLGPWFLWVHVWPPHSPYLAGSSLYKFLPERVLDTRTSQQRYDNKFYTPDQQSTIDKLRLRYDESIFNLDNELGDFFDSIKNRGVTKNTVIAISADHGEIFEKGYHEHGGAGCNYLYQPLIHIPLIIQLPGQSVGRVVQTAAEQIDIAPTFLDLIGISVPSWMEGESLQRAMNSGYDSGKPKFSMNLETCSTSKPITDGSIAVINSGKKYIYYPKTGSSELYDLNVDPGEKKNIEGEAVFRIEMQKLIKDKINAKQ